MTFGERLAQLRKRKGVSQYELADRLGFSRGQIANYEQGKREPDYETLKTLADFFDVSTDYLLGRTDVTTLEGTLPLEQADFLKWVEDNLQSAFFYDFHKSPETQKEELMETLRMLWELEQKKQAKRKNKDKG